MSDVPPQPLCIACGALIGYEEVYGGLENRVRELELVDAKSPVIRGSYYRAIFRTDNDSPYRLSGIGRFNTLEMGYLHVPENTDETPCSSLWFPPNPDGKTIPMDEVNFLTSFNDRSPGPYGYRVHMWCWSLIKRIIGESAEQNLDLLIETLRERWKEEPFEIPEYVMWPRNFIFPPAKVGWPKPERLTKSYRGKQLDYIHTHTLDKLRRVSDAATKNVIPLRDPYKNSGFKKLVKRCSENYAREETKRKTRKWCSISKSFRIGHLDLPLEIKFIILDYLDYRSVRSILLAFGWQIPDIYWRSRYPHDLIFELADMNLSSLADLDWKTLCLATEAMLENVPELQNRRRIFQVLKTTKELFDSKRGFENGNRHPFQQTLNC